MITQRTLLLAALAMTLATPAVLHAQFGGMGGRGGMGGMGGGRGGMGGPGGPGGMRRRMPEYVKAKELEKYNIAALLLDDAKKLHLTDAQRAQLTTLQVTIAERNAPLLAHYDSLHTNFTPPRPEDFRRRRNEGDDDRDRRDDPAADSSRIKAFMMAEAIDQLITRRGQDTADAMAILSDDARPRAQERIDKQTQEMEERLPRLRPRNPAGSDGPDGGGERRRRP